MGNHHQLPLYMYVLGLRERDVYRLRDLPPTHTASKDEYGGLNVGKMDRRRTTRVQSFRHPDMKLPGVPTQATGGNSATTIWSRSFFSINPSLHNLACTRWEWRVAVLDTEVRLSTGRALEIELVGGNAE